MQSLPVFRGMPRRMSQAPGAAGKRSGGKLFLRVLQNVFRRLSAKDEGNSGLPETILKAGRYNRYEKSRLSDRDFLLYSERKKYTTYTKSNRKLKKYISKETKIRMPKKGNPNQKIVDSKGGGLLIN